MEGSGIVLNLAGTIVNKKRPVSSSKKQKPAASRMRKSSANSRTASNLPKVKRRENATSKRRLSGNRNISQSDSRIAVPSTSSANSMKSDKRINKEKRATKKIIASSPSKLPTFGSSPKKSADVFAGSRFSDVAGLNERLVGKLESEDGFGFSRTTAIQKLTIPQLLAGRDCFVKSETGSGKTLAYAVPCVQKLSELEPRIQRQDGPYAIVLTPTRELTIQTYEVFEKLLKAFIWIVPGYIAGGEKRKSEKARLRKGISLLVCTPGRLTDHLKHTNSLSLEKVQWMVYDEADRLLDGGFEQDVKFLIDLLIRQRINPQCQSVLLSATMNKGVSQLADLTLVNPVFITPTADADQNNSETIFGEDFVLPKTLSQAYLVTPAKQRLLTLIALIFSMFKTKGSGQCKKMLVFLSTQDSVDFHYYLIDHIVNGDQNNEEEDTRKRKRARHAMDEDGLRFNIEIYRLHGSMGQGERTAVYKEFSKSERALLLATDVAARGLHIPRLDCIVQYNTPGAAAEYVHRVGRTARIGQSGNAILFLMPSELEYLDVLAEYGIRMKQVEQNDFLEALKTEAHASFLPDAMHEFQQRCEDFIYSRKDVYDMATKAFQSFVRSYAAYPYQLKTIFNVRSLHLGHLAKCFSLKETPTEVAALRRTGPGSSVRGSFRSRGRAPRVSDVGRPRFQRQQVGDRRHSSGSKPVKRRGPVDMSEYGSGLDSIKRT